MSTIQENLQSIKQRIITVATRSNRDPHSITLLAVSKTKPVTAITEAIEAGQRAFGENYVQEGVEKILHFQQSSWADELQWHFIGPLQTNKSRLVAEHFHWIHTVDRLRIAERLSQQRPNSLPPLNVLIQINISHEESKSGIAAEELMSLAKQIDQLPHLMLRGVMAIPAAEADPQRQLAVFQQLYSLFAQLQSRFPQVDTLSMGMSDDMEAAITAGSTMIRIGTAIFGARQYT